MPIHPMEPFRVKAIEPLRLTTPIEREHILQEAGSTLFKVRFGDRRHERHTVVVADAR